MGQYPLNHGKSPLLLTINSTGVGKCATCVEKPVNMTNWSFLEIQGMSGEMTATTPPPTCSPTGSPCLAGLGVTLNQDFALFLHIFYRAVPPPGWHFATDGDPPL